MAGEGVLADSTLGRSDLGTLSKVSRNSNVDDPNTWHFTRLISRDDIFSTQVNLLHEHMLLR